METSEPVRKRRLLYISYIFPPSGGVGAPRAANFARYLPQYAEQFYVLTVSNPATPLHDPTLLGKIAPETTVYRTWHPAVPYSWRDQVWKRLNPPRVHSVSTAQKPSALGAMLRPAKWAVREVIQRVLCPDAMVTWVPFAKRKAEEIIRRHDVDTVVLNSPPYSTLFIGCHIKKRFPHIRLITEIRDDWLGYYLVHFDTSTTGYKRRLATRTEAEAIHLSDYVTAVTPAQRDAIRTRYPAEPDDKFFCLPNGYDPDQYAGFRWTPRRGRKMLITYFGSAYTSVPYSPLDYLETVDRLPDAVRDRIETRFIGRVSHEAKPLLENRRHTITQVGFLPQQEAILRLQDSDFLLLVIGEASSHAGKLFDYLASGIPILGITPRGGEAARILDATRSGRYAQSGDREDIARMILAAFRDFESGNHRISPVHDEIEKFSWPRLVETLATTTGICPAAHPVHQ
jgi:glycosyltransferase involved in cell wall biosynthesis